MSSETTRAIGEAISGTCGIAISEIRGLGPTLSGSGNFEEGFEYDISIYRPEEFLESVKQSDEIRSAFKRREDCVFIESVINLCEDDWEPERRELIELMNDGKVDEARKLADDVYNAEATGFGLECHETALNSADIDEAFQIAMEEREMRLGFSAREGELAIWIKDAYPRSGYAMSEKSGMLDFDLSDGKTTILAREAYKDANDLRQKIRTAARAMREDIPLKAKPPRP